MSHLDPLMLARIQFGFTISFHIIFPAITIGLASYLAVLEGLWLLRGEPVYRDLYDFWAKVFAVNFAMGVVSGLVMSYEFGTNWSRFSTFAGGVTGPLLAYEVLTAFFLEAGFLGVMLFGWKKVGGGLHFFATLMVALGTIVSMTWILASNSWMQTPQGYAIEGGRIVPLDWWKIIFNPSFPYRLVHMGLAAYLATALMVCAAGAWHLLKYRDNPRVKTMFSMALWMVLVTAPLQIAAGDSQGRNTLEYQPAKIAAMEGHWSNKPGESVPLILFGWPDMKARKTLDAIEVPHLGSLILTHSWNGQIPGLDDFPARDRPDSTVIFWTFRLMVGLGVLMLLLGLGGLALRRGGRVYRNRLFLRFAVAMGPAGIVAILAGWMTTEIGRQPWVVYGVMRTADGVAHHSAAALTTSLIVFVVVYFAVFGTGISYLLKLIAQGPDRGEGGLDPHPLRRAARPLSAAPDIDPAPGGTARGAAE
jgi:cytochrome d ubiquinol oxidase subunit I